VNWYTKLKNRLALSRRGKWGGALAFGLGVLSVRGAEAELVEVATQSYTRLGDGSLQVTFQNGRSVIVPEGDWTIVGGRVFIEEVSINQAGTGTSGVAAISGPGQTISIFGQSIPAWQLMSGAMVTGYLIGDQSSDDGSSSDTTSTLEASRTALSGSIRNTSNHAGDDVGTVVIGDLSPAFENAEGTLTYSIQVVNGAGTSVTDLLYINGSELRILKDPEVDYNGIYTVTITGTDTANGNTATASAYVTVEVESEARKVGTMADVSKDHNDKMLDTVVADVGIYFEDAEGTFTYDVQVVGANDRDFGNVVLKFSGDNQTKLVLASDITESFVEFLNEDPDQETIVLTVYVTATDSSDGTKLSQTFSLTLDASGENTSSELANGHSSMITLNEDTSNAELVAGSSVKLDLSNYVFDEDTDDILTWSIVSDSAASELSINTNTGLIEGALGSDVTDGIITVEVSDSDNPEPVTLSVYIDIA